MDLDLSSEITEILNSEGGCDITITDVSASTSADIRAIWREPFEVNDLNDLDMEGSLPYVKCKSSEVSHLIQDDTVTRRSIIYKIKNLEPDDVNDPDWGWTRINLYKANS
jgi:hypothetical protein